MQEREFDHLMNGEPSKMAIIDNKLPFNKNLREFIQEHEQSTPAPVVKAVDIWIARCRSLGMSEKNIKKSVKKRFNITVVK